MIQRIRRSRMIGWDRNPLRRRIDRVEAVMVIGLIAAFLVAAPVLAAVAGHETWAASLRQQRADAAWRQVPATVQRGTPAQRDGSPGPTGTVWVLARWTAPDGQPRSGLVPVSPAAPAGSRRWIWVNRAGSLTGPPPRHSWMAMAGVLTPYILAVILLLSLTGYAGRCLLGRRRLADWDRAWEAVGPKWTRQR